MTKREEALRTTVEWRAFQLMISNDGCEEREFQELAVITKSEKTWLLLRLFETLSDESTLYNALVKLFSFLDFGFSCVFCLLYFSHFSIIMIHGFWLSSNRSLLICFIYLLIFCSLRTRKNRKSKSEDVEREMENNESKKERAANSVLVVREQNNFGTSFYLRTWNYFVELFA